MRRAKGFKLNPAHHAVALLEKNVRKT